MGSIIKILRKIRSQLYPQSNPRVKLLKYMPKNATCAEVGSWKGNFSKMILRFNKPRKLFLIDPYMYVENYDNALYGGLSGSQENMDAIHDSVVNMFSDNIAKGEVQMIRKPSKDGIENLEDSGLDWIYIDGNHTHKYVIDDLKASWKKVKTGGYVTGDDYGVPGWWDDGVTTAVDEFIKTKKEFLGEVKIIGSQFILQKAKS